MLNKIGRCFLNVSSLSPILIFYGWIICLQQDFFSAYLFFAIGIGLAVCCFLSFLSHKNLEKIQFHPKNIEPDDRENVTIMLFLICPLLISLSLFIDGKIILSTFGVFALLMATGLNRHPHLLLGIFGWRAFKVTSNEGVVYRMLSKRCPVNTSPMTIGQISEYLLIDLEKH